MRRLLLSWRFLVLTSGFLLIGTSIVLAAGSGYHLVKKIPVGGEGGWDYLSFDDASRRLYIARATRVIVIDVDRATVVGEIRNTPGVHGIALAPELSRGFTSNGTAGSVTIFDLKTLKELGQTKTTGANPDAILYDPASRRVFTMNGRGNNSTAIDASTGTVAGTIALGGRPEFAVADGRGRLYVNLEDKAEELVIDSRKMEIVARWKMAPCEEPSGLAIDLDHRRLFAGCHNQIMLVMDADTGKVVTTVPIGRGVDANSFDPVTQFAFSSNGDGTLTVVHEDSPDKFTVLENVGTQRGARTMALDSKTHNVFLITAEFGPPSPPTPEQPRPRPTVLPNTFVVLVFGR